MKKFLYLITIVAALVILVIVILTKQVQETNFGLIINLLAVFFLLIFGSYGLYAEVLFGRLRSSGKTENLCVEASYLIQKRGLVSKIVLFPFLKIKSSNSFVISLLGALSWMVIFLIIIQVFFK